MRLRMRRFHHLPMEGVPQPVGNDSAHTEGRLRQHSHCSVAADWGKLNFIDRIAGIPPVHGEISNGPNQAYPFTNRGSSARTGAGGELHQQPAQGRAPLTTNEGVLVSPTTRTRSRRTRAGRPCWKTSSCGKRSPTFDHERIPERIVHARGSGAHGFFEAAPNRSSQYTKADFLQRVGEKTPVFVRFSTVAGGAGSGDLPRDVRGFATKFYTRGRQFRSGRQQYPSLLHPGRDEVPRPHSFGEDGARPRLSAGSFGARHVLGLRVADARKHAHDHVGDVGPRDPALLAHDRRVWRQYLSPRRRQRQADLCQVSLAAEARHAVGALGRGGQDQRRRPRLSPSRPV